MRKIADAIVRRLPLYLQTLDELDKMNVPTVSSQVLGERLALNPAQIRKDLATFGEFGRKGVGYNVGYLIQKIHQILGLNHPINMVLVGAGNLGKALSNYSKYLQENMRIVAVFDVLEHRLGEIVNHFTVEPMTHLKQQVTDLDVRIGIITTPSTFAQYTADQLVHAGVKGILTFASPMLQVPEDVRVHYADFTQDLLSLAYYLVEDDDEEPAGEEQDEAGATIQGGTE
jgi:redox-sensing transcriptional repressor